MSQEHLPKPFEGKISADLIATSTFKDVCRIYRSGFAMVSAAIVLDGIQNEEQARYLKLGIIQILDTTEAVLQWFVEQKIPSIIGIKY